MLINHATDLSKSPNQALQQDQPLNCVAALHEAQAQLAALQASSSWRMTAPLRWVTGMIKSWLIKPVAHPVTKVLAAKDYGQWVRDFDSPSSELLDNLRQQVAGFAQLPLFSILLPVEMPSLQSLSRAIASVQQQIYPNWELCIALSANTPADIRLQVSVFALTEPRIKFVQLTDVSASVCNAALGLADAGSAWVIKIGAVDKVAIQALVAIAIAVNEHKECVFVYADEDVMDAAGERSLPFFKCAWNRELHYSRDLVGRYGVYRTSQVRALGGYIEGTMQRAIDFDLSLRYLEHIKPTQIVHLPQVLFYAGQAEPLATEQGKAALEAHFARLNLTAWVENIGHGYHIHYELPKVLPWVSLIIPTRNGVGLLRQCIDSIQTKTVYPNYDIIIVDNGSDDAETLAYFQLFSNTPNVQVLRIDAPFNYSALNNAAVALAKGELVGLLNNDIEVISPDWLHEMVSHAVQPDVGAVGARLWFPDGTLQHGGVVLGIHGWAAHAHNHFPAGSLGYQGRMALVSEFSAVTGACLVVKKTNYLAVGGLNDMALKISCNDVDFCLKLQQLGLRNVWTPFADLVHHESATRGFEDTSAKQARFAGELAYMQQHWGDALKNDPAYSPNLTLAAQDFGLAWPPRVPTLVRPVATQPGQPPLYERLAALAKAKVRITYFAENVHSSTFRYRAANMVQVLNQPVASGNIETSSAFFFSGDLQYTADIVDNADILVISRVRYDLDIAHLIQQFKMQNKKIWFDIDDLVFDTNYIDLIIYTSGQEPTDDVLNYWYGVVGRMAQVLRLCDGVITTNEYLANKIKQFNNLPVKIIPNFVNAAQLAASAPLYQHKLATGSMPRERIKLGYFSGSSSHNADVALIAGVLERVMAADARIDLVLVGHLDVEQAFGARFGGYLKGHLAERVTVHSFVDFVALQELIADVDFNLVPLQVNEFTHCKSELKFVDAAIVGTLTIASPAFAYAEAIRHGENGYLAEDDLWEAVLLQAIAVRDADFEQHRRMTAAAWQDVQQRFTWQTQRPAILQALEVS